MELIKMLPALYPRFLLHLISRWFTVLAVLILFLSWQVTLVKMVNEATANIPNWGES